MKIQKQKDMVQLVLQDVVLDKIKSDADLFAMVAKSLRLSPSTLPSLLNRNDAKLTQASVLKAIKDYTGLTDNEILEEEVAETATA